MLRRLDKKKLFFLFFFIFIFSIDLFSKEPLTKDDTCSRFITINDENKKNFAGVPLPDTWWSRPYEYAWAEKFADENDVVLDAAAGIPHPFKWVLAENCKEVWACDIDIRILFFDFQIIHYDEATILKNKDKFPIWQSINLELASICSLPFYMPKFDKIFCISTLEHMKTEDQKKALKEFSEKLNEDGLLIITVDYPDVMPSTIIEYAAEFDLIPAGEVIYDLPANALKGTPYYPNLRIFRLLLKHDKK